MTLSGACKGNYSAPERSIANYPRASWQVPPVVVGTAAGAPDQTRCRSDAVLGIIFAGGVPMAALYLLTSRALSNRMTRSAQIARNGRWPCLARETHVCAARPATGAPVTMFSSWRLFSEELPIADIPGIMMRLGARHLNV